MKIRTCLNIAYNLTFLSLLFFASCNKEMQPPPLTAPNIQLDNENSTLQIMSDSFTHALLLMRTDIGLLETHYNSNTLSLYDNSIAAMVFCISDNMEEARSIFDYFNDRLFSEFLSGSGGFFQFRDRNGQPYGNRWLGDNAWLLIALNNYQNITGDNRYQTMQYSLGQWIREQQDVDGGLWGGEDINGSVIGKVTEGMIDAFNAVKGYDNFHKGMLTYLATTRWNENEMAPISWPGNPYEYALDNFSWGYCAFENMPTSILDHAKELFYTTQWCEIARDSVSGYCFDIDKDVVWFEGSAQMAVALNKAGMTSDAQELLMDMLKAKSSVPDLPSVSGLPYASNLATGYGSGLLWQGASTEPSVSSTCWFVMACKNFDPMQLQYTKQIPIEDQFWL